MYFFQTPTSFLVKSFLGKKYSQILLPARPRKDLTKKDVDDFNFAAAVYLVKIVFKVTNCTFFSDFGTEKT